ncbi:cell wall-binding repeat-containing protein [Halosimplex aquaticum]|uniref:Cell wall-binding repeat-containing protein n=1 Tax=Halosimplex aquaticum TaxID=3026162 RepID=A0ABD5Y285_9EURY|nr:cell wall-binding repeat-containing protein [Halosimplex aquaticum]
MTDQSRREFLQDLATVPALAGLGGAALSVDSNLFAGDGEESMAPATADFNEWTATTMTTRLAGENMYETAAAYCQSVYTAINEHTRPGAVILVNDSVLEAALPGVGLIHHPIDGAVLLTRRDELPQATRDEIERAHPEGVGMDDNVQVYLIGSERYISDSVRQEVESMGMNVRRIPGEGPVSVAAGVDQYVSSMHGNHEDEVLVASLDAPRRAVPVQSWNAHAGDGFLWVEGDSIPEETAEQLEARYDYAYMYLLGDEAAISSDVARDLGTFGHVTRVPDAGNPYSISAAWAGYKDIGRNQGWWFGEWARGIGWGLADPGHNFIFANPDEWQTAVPASVESHRGKHGPILAVRQDELPTPVENYLRKFFRPTEAAPYDRKYNHGWIAGPPDVVSRDVQAQVHGILEGGGPS